MNFSRRSLFGAGALGALSGLGGPALGDHKPGGKRPKNIIFCVADGMAMATVTMWDQFHRLTQGGPSVWGALLNADYATNGLQRTSSLNSLVTDSAAASSSWGSGRHIWNGQLNTFPDGTKLRTLTSLMQGAGVRTGLVTTTTITHATPAGFSINCFRRDDEAQIALEYLASGVDVLMGGGSRFFAPDARKDGRDLYADFAKAGYAVAKNKAELAALSSPKRVLGVFNDSHMPYTVDQRNSPELSATKPTLADMVTTALAALKDSPKGFLLQIEGGKVDHGAHANDFAAMLYEQMGFEEAVKVALDFALKDGDTLVVMTADHATGGPALNGAGEEYIDSTAGLLTLANMKASYEYVLKPLGKEPSAAQVRDVVNAKLGLTLSNDEAQAVADAARGKSPFAVSDFYRSPTGTLAAVLGNHSKVTWTSQNHTSDHVLVTAVGPGREAFGGVTENVRYFDILLGFKGLKHSNPTMTFEDAKRYMAAKKA